MVVLRFNAKGRLSISVSLLIQDWAAEWNLRHPFAFRLKGAFMYIFSYLWKQGLTKERLVFHKAVKIRHSRRRRKMEGPFVFAAYMKTVSVATCQTYTFSKVFPIYAYSCYCTTLWANNTPGSSLCFPCIGYAQVKRLVLYPSYHQPLVREEAKVRRASRF